MSKTQKFGESIKVRVLLERDSQNKENILENSGMGSIRRAQK